MTRPREDLVLTLLFTVFVGGILWLSVSLSPVARLAPVFVAVPTVVLLLVELARQWKSPSPHATADPGRRRREGQMFLWMAVLLVAGDLLGMAVGLPLFLLAYLRLRSRESWTVSLVVPAVLCAILFGVLSTALRVPLDGGRLLGWLGLS